MSDDAVRRLSSLDTATLSDALDRLGLAGQCAGITPRSPSFRLSGRAFTVGYAPAATPPGTVGDYVDEVEAGQIVVLDNGGREDATVWGDILTEIAHRRGLGGTVINGVGRDLALCLELGYAVFSRGSFMRTGKDRVQMTTMQEPVALGTTRVCPGDLVRGDADGVVVIARGDEERVLVAAEEIQHAEDAIRGAIRGGRSLRDARREHGYHHLQSKR